MKGGKIEKKRKKSGVDSNKRKQKFLSGVNYKDFYDSVVADYKFDSANKQKVEISNRGEFFTKKTAKNSKVHSRIFSKDKGLHFVLTYIHIFVIRT